MSAYPRTLLPSGVTPFDKPTALAAWGQSGKAQTRGFAAVGRWWQETYPLINIGDANGYAFLEFLRRVKRTGEVFTIDHRAHQTHLGGGTGSPLVMGASQTGTSLVTDGWTGTDPVLKEGTVIRVAGISYAIDIAANAPNLAAGVTTLTIDPPFLTGSSPADNAAITYTGVTINAILVSANFPACTPDGYIAGLSVMIREAP